MNKPKFKSKINWLGAIVTLLGFMMQPETQQYFGAFVPPEVLGKLVAGAGLATIVIRSFFTEVAYEVNREE